MENNWSTSGLNADNTTVKFSDRDLSGAIVEDLPSTIGDIGDTTISPIMDYASYIRRWTTIHSNLPLARPPSTQQTGRALGTLYINDSGELYLLRTNVLLVMI